MAKITKPESIVESFQSSTKEATAKPNHDEGGVPIHDKADRAGNGGRGAHRSSKAAVRPKSAESQSTSSKEPKSGSSSAPPPNADAPASEPATATTKGPSPKKQTAAKAKLLSPQEALDLMWARDDLFEFLRVLAFVPPDLVDRSKEFQRVLRLIRRRAAAEPEELVRDVLKSGETLIAYLILRLENQIMDRLREFDASFDRGARDFLPQAFFDRVLPNWVEMQRHLGQLALARASVSRQMGLARAKHLENDQLERELKTLSTSAVSIDGSQSAQEAAPTEPPPETGQTEPEVEDMIQIPYRPA